MLPDTRFLYWIADYISERTHYASYSDGISSVVPILLTYHEGLFFRAFALPFILLICSLEYPGKECFVKMRLYADNCVCVV